MIIDNIGKIDSILLQEKQLQIGKQASSGQIVFLAGSPGSGKNWVINNMTDIKNRFKVFDIDEIKEYYISYEKLRNRVISYYEGILKDLSNTEDKTLDQIYRKNTVEEALLRYKKDFRNSMLYGDAHDLLHDYIVQNDLFSKKVEKLILSIIDNPGNLPNIAFNSPMRNTNKPSELIELLQNLGYKKKNTNILWVVTSRKQNIKNVTRRGGIERTTNFNYHMAAISQVNKTMNKVIKNEDNFSVYVNNVYVVYNEQEKIKRYNNSDIISGFEYDTIKIGDTSKLEYINSILNDEDS